MADVIHPSANQLERLAAELPVSGDVAAHVGACADCAARMREITADRDAFLVRNPPAARVAAIVGTPRRRWWAPVAALAAAVAAAALLVWWLSQPRVDHPTYVAAKGDHGPLASVRVKPRAGGFARPLADGPVAPGDTLVVELNPADYKWAQILSVAGEPVLLDELPAPVDGDARTYVVDDEDHDEAIVVVFARHPLTASEVAAMLRAPDGVVVQRFAIPKQKPPRPRGSDVSPP